KLIINLRNLYVECRALRRNMFTAFFQCGFHCYKLFLKQINLSLYVVDLLLIGCVGCKESFYPSFFSFQCIYLLLNRSSLFAYVGLLCFYAASVGEEAHFLQIELGSVDD